VLVFWAYSDLIEAAGEVQLGEDLGASESVEHFIDAWEWVFVFDSDFVEGSIVDDHPSGAIFLGA